MKSRFPFFPKAALSSLRATVDQLLEAGLNKTEVRKFCSIEGCERPLCARGWCKRHWARWSRYGDPLAGAQPHCRRIGSVDDRPFCMHGPMVKMGKRGFACAWNRRGINRRTYRNGGDIMARRRALRKQREQVLTALHQIEGEIALVIES